MERLAVFKIIFPNQILTLRPYINFSCSMKLVATEGGRDPLF